MCNDCEKPQDIYQRHDRGKVKMQWKDVVKLKRFIVTKRTLNIELLIQITTLILLVT